MILYCWRDGSVGVARELPVGAIELARGGERTVNALLCEIQGMAGVAGRAQLPGLDDEADDQRALDTLRACMQRLGRTQAGAGVAFNHALDLRFVGSD